MRNKTIVFDLDDTLIKEIDYLKSAYKEIAYYVDAENINLYNTMISLYGKGENVFRYLELNYESVSIKQLLKLYRNHLPNLNLNPGATEILKFCKSKGYSIGLITDGRSNQQNNKLDAMGIKHFFDKIIISEEFGFSKPSVEVYNEFKNFKGQKYYIADNTSKDFITANALGWITICILDFGHNIHKQNFNLPQKYLPHYKAKNLMEAQIIINSPL